MIRLQTTFGAIDIELDFEKAPNTSANFEQYVKDGFYDGTIFHRVIKNFMIQGGGFDVDMTQKTTRENIKNEADNGLENLNGTLAMARTNDPHSASSQFFINVKDNSFLDFTSASPEGWGYCVFAKVVDGMNVVDQIKSQSTTSKNGHQDVPAETVFIEKAEIIEA
jgi:peptidyl-prolyl cis-trans isomerase B (cyclophilin B)